MIGGIDLRCCGGVRTGSRLLLALWIKQEGNSNLSQYVVQWCVDCHWLATSNNTKSERCPFITKRQTDKRVTCSDGLTATSDEMMESTVIPKWLILPIHLSPNVVILLERKKAKKLVRLIVLGYSCACQWLRTLVENHNVQRVQWLCIIIVKRDKRNHSTMRHSIQNGEKESGKTVSENG